MTNPGNQGHTDPDEFERMALGFGQRRTVLVASVLGGLCIAGAGLGWLLGLGVSGQPLGPGLAMTGVGLVLAGIGWLASVGARFTHKLPKPLSGSEKVSAAAQNRVRSGWIALIVVLLGCVAIVLFTPRGKEPDVVAALPMIVAFPAVFILGLMRIRRILMNRKELYTVWLAKHHR